MRIQENLHLYKTVKLGEEILKNISPYTWLKDLLNSNIAINYALKIPSDRINNKFIYGARMIPYFRIDDTKYIDIPSIIIDYEDVDEEGNISFSNSDIELRARYDFEHPWYCIDSFMLSFEYLKSLIGWFVIEIQLAEHLDYNPLDRKSETHYSDFWFHVFKDGTQNHSQNGGYEIRFDSFSISNIIQSFNRAPFFSIKYPIYREMMLSSIILSQKKTLNENKFNVPGINYDDHFYAKIWVPAIRSLSLILKYSWWFQNTVNH